MSYDPSASGPDLPPEYDPAAQAPGGLEGIKARVQPAAIALIVVGVLNLLLALFQVGGTIWMAVAPQQIQKILEDMQKDAASASNPFLKAMLEAQKEGQIGSPASVIQNIVVCLLMLLVVVLNLLGGMRMMALKSYPLGIAGAISAAIPCISCGGCCCFGEIIGIWAFVVLLNPDVRAAFQ